MRLRVLTEGVAVDCDVRVIFDRVRVHLFEFVLRVAVRSTWRVGVCGGGLRDRGLYLHSRELGSAV